MCRIIIYINTIEEQEIFDPISLREYFWDMFIGDAS